MTALIGAACAKRLAVAFFALNRRFLGPQRLKGRLPDEEANRITAYHEAGHTLVAFYTKESIPLHKVTIIPRGQALGHVSRVFILLKFLAYVNTTRRLSLS